MSGAGSEGIRGRCIDVTAFCHLVRTGCSSLSYPRTETLKHTVMQVGLLFLWVGNLVSYIKNLVEGFSRERF